MLVGGKTERPSVAGGQGHGTTKQVLGSGGEKGLGLVSGLREGGSEGGWR